MKPVVFALFLLGTMFFQRESTERRNKNLTCKLDIEPKKWRKADRVSVTFTLENKSRAAINIATAVPGRDSFWYRLKIVDARGQVITSGLENQFLATDDLPALLWQSLKFKERVSVSVRLILDRGSGMVSYDLKPGKYFVSAIYRFEPGKEPQGADYYEQEWKENGLWSGVLASDPVEIEIMDN